MAFEYHKGYEIDGSDTCYNIISPEVEKIKEIFNYYLNLKIIDKNIPIKIYSVNYKKKHELVGGEYFRHELDKLWEDISGINNFEVVYKYVSPNSLYPEIKRELIDYIIKSSSIKESELVNPTFLPDVVNTSYISVNFYTEKSKRNYIDVDGIHSDKYYEKVKNTRFHNINIDCILGSSSPLKYYAIKKMSLAFPEYEIDPNESLYNISWYDVDIEKFIYEEIIVDSNDCEFSLNKIINNKNIEYCNKKNTLELKHSRYLYKVDENQKYEYINLNGKKESYRNYDNNKVITATYDIFTKYFDNTIKSYISYAKKLSELSFISSEQFFKYSSINLKVKKSKEEFEYMTLGFKKDKNNLKISLIIPQKTRNYIEKTLGL
jgi:hypothetical protein